MKIPKVIGISIFIICLGIIIYNFFTYFISNSSLYLKSDYSNRFKNLEKTFLDSQYIKKNPKFIVTDDIVYSYSAGKYINGESPILINPEMPPMGKYLIGVSIYLFNNENIFNLVASFFSLVLLYALSFQVIKSFFWSIFPLLLLSFESIFKNQITNPPLLDIFHLDFLLLSFIFFNIALNKKTSYPFFVSSSFFLGCFISTKFFAPGFLLMVVFLTTVFIFEKKKLKTLILSMIISPMVLILSYSRLFFLGHSLREVIGIQKWVYFYNSGHLASNPFAFWDLILFNRWHTWWADRQIIKDEAWSFIWPGAMLLFFSTLVFDFKNITRKNPLIFVQSAWIILYIIMLSFGQVTTRYFLILMPFVYIVFIFGLKKFSLYFLKKGYRKIIITCLILAFLPIFAQKSFAQSKNMYVLPYPGTMPGSKLYLFSEALDYLKGWYSFGDFAQFKYNLSESDKYLVQAKILFEYNQYPLALRSLKKSDEYFIKTFPHLAAAKKHNKDISDNRVLLSSAADKHIEVLKQLRSELPDSFVWQDEKKLPLNLSIKNTINSSIKVRQRYE